MEGSQEDAQGSSVLASGELFGRSKARSVAKCGLGLGDEDTFEVVEAESSGERVRQ